MNDFSIYCFLREENIKPNEPYKDAYLLSVKPLLNRNKHYDYTRFEDNQKVYSTEEKYVPYKHREFIQMDRFRKVANGKESPILHIKSGKYLTYLLDKKILVLSSAKHDIFIFSEHSLQHKSTGLYLQATKKPGYANVSDVFLYDFEGRIPKNVLFVFFHSKNCKSCKQRPIGGIFRCIMKDYYLCEYCYHLGNYDHRSFVRYLGPGINEYGEKKGLRDCISCIGKCIGRSHYLDSGDPNKVICENCFFQVVHQEKKRKESGFKHIDGFGVSFHENKMSLEYFDSKTFKVLFDSGVYGPLSIVFSYLTFTDLTKNLARVSRIFNRTYMNCRRYIFKTTRGIGTCPFSKPELKEMLHPKNGIGRELSIFVTHEIMKPNLSEDLENYRWRNEMEIPMPEDKDIDLGHNKWFFRNIKRLNILIYCVYNLFVDPAIFILENFLEIDPNEQEFSATQLVFLRSPSYFDYGIGRNSKRVDLDEFTLRFLRNPRVDFKCGEKNAKSQLNISCSHALTKTVGFLLEFGGPYRKKELANCLVQAKKKEIVLMFTKVEEFDLFGFPEPLYYSSNNGEFEKVKALLDWGKLDILECHRKDENQLPLMRSSVNGRVRCLGLILKFMEKRGVLTNEWIKKAVLGVLKKIEFQEGGWEKQTDYTRRKIRVLEILFFFDQEGLELLKNRKEIFIQENEKLRKVEELLSFETISQMWGVSRREIGDYRCTFEVTGKEFKIQRFYDCLDCKIMSGICNICKETCHKNHNVVESDSSPGQFYCDCVSCVSKT